MNTRQAALTMAAICASMAIAAAGHSQARIMSVATVDVSPPLSFGTLEEPSWGELMRPSRGTAQYRLDYRSNAVTALGHKGQSLRGGHYGAYGVSGAPAMPVSYVVTIGTFDGEGVRAIASHVNGLSEAGVSILGWDGNLVLQIGGILEVDAEASSAPQNAVVTIAIDYQ